MTKQEQIEEMTKKMQKCYEKNGLLNFKWFAEALYNAGYGNVSEYKAERELLGSQIKVLKQRLNDKYIEVDNLNRDYHNSFERLKAQEREIERLKAENERFENNMKNVLEIEKKQAKIDVLTEVKESIKTAINNYWESNGGGYYLAEDAINDIDDLITEIGGINNDH